MNGESIPVIGCRPTSMSLQESTRFELQTWSELLT